MNTYSFYTTPPNRLFAGYCNSILKRQGHPNFRSQIHIFENMDAEENRAEPDSTSKCSMIVR